MPSAPLVELGTLDLSRIVATRDDILSKLPHRGRFAMLDGILHFDPEDRLVIGFKEIRVDDWWATDHIPGRPIFPGALICEAAAQLCSYHYMRRNPIPAGSFLGFGGMDDTRFRGIVQPPCRLVLVGRPEKLRNRMFSYSAQGFVERDLVFETTILGVIF